MLNQLGSILVADDQLINLEVLKNTLREIGIAEKASYYVNG
jgi:CheY-like chemotaxis protein